MKLLRDPHAALGGARNHHVQEVRSGSCAPSALPEGRSPRFLNREQNPINVMKKEAS